MTELQSLALDASKWEVVYPQDRTVSFRNNHFQLCSALACVIKKKHVNVHMNFPWLAFLWLISPLPLNEQYNSVSCKDRLGHWFKS